ncbi:MAG: RnfABCDGE type electron transport complex subunit D [Erysipelotrichaceae bacterium]|nr:RnfABCDGE type electron transport complex subunit D [Erysipelotrichaceae bacterium]
MKISFKASPNVTSSNTTDKVMSRFSLGLVFLFVGSLIIRRDPQTIARGIGLLATSLSSALITEAIYFKVTKKPVWSHIRHSYSWITALIMTMFCLPKTGFYPLFISTAIAVFFGKLVFGGFGNNIFNPAALGVTILFTCFKANPDLASGATPLSAMAESGWVFSMADRFSAFVSQYGGFMNMIIGRYDGAIGETSSLLILIMGAYLIWRKVISPQFPLVYMATIFVSGAIVGLINGQGIGYGSFHVLAGSVMLTAFTMLCDPVTTPVTRRGRTLYAIGAGLLTMIVRLKADASEGTLYAILLMNTFTPAIDMMMDGVRARDARKHTLIICLIAALGFGLVGVSATTLETNLAKESEVLRGELVSLESDFTEFDAKCDLKSDEGGVVTYACAVKGFGEINPNGYAELAGVSYSRNNLDIAIDKNSGTVKSVTMTHYGDTPGVGDNGCDQYYLDSFAGVGPASEVEVMTGTTWTSKSVMAAVQKALANVNAVPALGKDYSEYEAACEVSEKADGKTVYACEAKGFGMINNMGGEYKNNSFTITVDDQTNTLIEVKLKKFGDTEEVGDAAVAKDYLAKFAGLGVDGDINVVSGATFTSNSVIACAQKALSGTQGAAEASTGAVLPKEYEEYAPACELKEQDGGVAVYTCEAKGFGTLNGMDGYKNNVVEVIVDPVDGKAVEVSVKTFGDTEGVGDSATKEDYLKTLSGKAVGEKMDVVSGATFTSKSVQACVNMAMVDWAARTGGSLPAGTAEPGIPNEYLEFEPVCELKSQDGGVNVFACEAKGFGTLNGMDGYKNNKVEVVIDPVDSCVTQVTVTTFGDTEGVGDKATTEDYLSTLKGHQLGEKMDGVSGATFTANSVKACVQAALYAHSQLD